MRQPLRAAAARQHGAFSTRQAPGCHTSGESRARVRCGQWIRVFAGSYRHSGAQPNARLRVSAAGLSIGTPLVACLHTAAELHGFGVLDRDPTTHVIAAGGRAHARRAGL